jgi:hypothetical protein
MKTTSIQNLCEMAQSALSRCGRDVSASEIMSNPSAFANRVDGMWSDLRRAQHAAISNGISEEKLTEQYNIISSILWFAERTAVAVSHSGYATERACVHMALVAHDEIIN